MNYTKIYYIYTYTTYISDTHEVDTCLCNVSVCIVFLCVCVCARACWLTGVLMSLSSYENERNGTKFEHTFKEMHTHTSKEKKKFSKYPKLCVDNEL